jgi:3-methyladenine DNA glycosylase AlkC
MINQLIKRNMPANQPLSNIQLELLKVFSRPVSDEDLKAIKQLLSTYFAQKAASLADDVWEQEGFTEETMQEWRQTHLRTDYSVRQKGSTQS